MIIVSFLHGDFIWPAAEFMATSLCHSLVQLNHRAASPNKAGVDCLTPGRFVHRSIKARTQIAPAGKRRKSHINKP